MPKHIGILCAMPQEIGTALTYLRNTKVNHYGDLKIYSGDLFLNNESTNSIYLSIAWSGWGKVSSARAATRLIANKYKNIYISALFFFGVAGAINTNLKQWDIILSEKLVQHDMDARPIFKKYVIPSIKDKYLLADLNIVDWSLNQIKKAKSRGLLKGFNDVYSGLIATGDKFVGDNASAEKLRSEFDDLLCVEMEGASVAQVAIQEKVPWLIIRVISDNANESSHQDFDEFIDIYKVKSSEIVMTLIKNISSAPLSS